MLEMQRLVLGFFKLILGVPIKLIPNIKNKGLEISKIFKGKSFEFWPYDWSSILIVTPMLCSPKAHGAIMKWSCKYDTILPNCIWYFEMILILQTKVVIVHVVFSQICFQKPSLKKLFSKFFLLLDLSALQKCLYKLGEEIICWKRKKKKSKSFRKYKSLIALGIGSLHWALGANKLILFFKKIDQKIDARVSLCSKFQSHCQK